MKSRSPLLYRLLKPLYEKAAQGMCRECKDFISRNSKILDLGCGSGIVIDEFRKRFDSEIFGVDIIDNRVIDIPFKKIEGGDLSCFDDNSFDTVMISFVLHHSKDPIELLKEAKRVARKNVIIYENLPEGFIPSIACKIHGESFAKYFQKNKETGKFFKREEWLDIFKNLGLNLIYEQRVSSFLNPLKEELFVISKGV
jgi:ubiquinone/menaquinone biosynthesis C-methylase UbiE